MPLPQDRSGGVGSGQSVVEEPTVQPSGFIGLHRGLHLYPNEGGKKWVESPVFS